MRAAWGRTLGRDASSAASDERSLRSFIAYCQDTLAAPPQLAPSPVTQALVDAEKRRAIGLAPAVTSVLESHRAAQGSLRAFMDWCTMVATVAADVERALADVAEEESAALGAAAELALTRQAASGSGSEGGGGAVVEAAAALSAGPLASAARMRAYAHELRGLYACLLSLLQAMLDGACAALLDRAEDYSGEAKGVKELLSVDVFAVHASAAAASPSGVRVAPGPFVRQRSGGEMVVWGSMTGQRVNRNPKPFSGPTVEVEFQKGCLGTAVNVAVRVNTLCTASERVPGGGGAQGEGGGAGGSARAKPRPKSALKAPPVAAAAAAAAATPAAGEEGKEGVEGGEEGKSGEEGAAAAAAAPKPTAAALLPSVPLRPLGGWICLDQLLMPPPILGIRGWAMTPAAAPPMPSSASGQPSSAASPLLRMEHPAASNSSAASTTSVKVKWRLPSHIVLGPLEHVCPASGAAAPSPRALLPGRWSAERGEWTTESVLDPSFHAASRTVQFSAIGFVPHALLQPLAADFPYRAWRLTPHAGAPGGHAAVLHLTTARGIEVALHCAAAGCTLLAPCVPELAFLTHGGEGEEGEGEGGGDSASSGRAPCLPPGQVLAALRACGLHLAPSDSDAPAVARLLEEEGGGRALAPLLPPCVEAALHADMAHAAASFTLEGVAGRGYVAGQAPPDPTDAPPNADAAVLAQVRALETLVPLGAGHTAGDALAWRAGASAMQRITVREDRGLPRGCSLQAAPEGEGGSSAGSSAGSATFAALDACLLASAAPEASAWLASAPPVFTETVRRLLCMVRPLNFSA